MKTANSLRQRIFYQSRDKTKRNFHIVMMCLKAAFHATVTIVIQKLLPMKRSFGTVKNS